MGALGALLALALLTISPAAATLRFGVAAEPYPPFASRDESGNWVGWEIDLMNAVCKAMNEECAIFESSWDGMIPALKAGYFDVIWATMSITPDRLSVIDFTDPYYAGPDIVIGQRTGDKDVTPAHLAGRTVGVQVGSIHVKIADHHYKDARVKAYALNDEALQDLTSGRLDYVFGDAGALSNFLSSATGQCCEFKGLLPVATGTAYPGAAGGIRKGDEALKAKLNAALKSVMASGEYAALAKKYFTFDIAPKP